MKVEEVLNESMAMGGPLGAVAFVALEALARGGASAEESEQVRQLLFRCFAELTDEQSNVLAEVAHRRLATRPASGHWY